jgi:hypothetical protein
VTGLIVNASTWWGLQVINYLLGTRIQAILYLYYWPGGFMY